LSIWEQPKRVRVRKESFQIDKDDTNIVCSGHTLATLWQNQDIKSKLDNLCQELGQCGIHQDATGIMAIIHEKLIEATERQASLGSRGTYRHVEFEVDEVQI
jgi:hypothetical protein